MVHEAEWLGYAVRFRVLAKYGGQLLLALTALVVPPAVVALIAADFGFAWRCGVVIAALASTGLLMSRIRAPRNVQVNEGMVTTGLVFLVAAFAMSVPMAAAPVPFADVLFECISGVTTTGLTTVADVSGQSPAFLFTRAWMQWFGGLGVAIFALVFLTRTGIAAKRLAADDTEQDLVGSTRERARRVVLAYVGITVLGFGAIAAASRSATAGLLFATTAVSTGGFAPDAASLGALGSPWVAAVVLLFCLVGAVLHPFYRPTQKPRWREILGDAQVKALLIACLVLAGALLFSLRYASHLSWGQALIEAPMLAVTSQTTTGFNRIAPSAIDGVSKILVIMAMFIGGGVGSTAGGFKLLRMLVFIRCVQALVVRTSLPSHAVYEPTVAGHTIEEHGLREAVAVVSLMLAFTVLSWLPFVAYGYDPLDSLFDVVSAMGTVGLSTGIVGPHLPGSLKAVLSVDMFLGRLETLAWLVILYPRTWIGRRAEP